MPTGPNSRRASGCPKMPKMIQFRLFSNICPIANDSNLDRDHLTHSYFAGHGYAGVRADMRGTGDSEGICLGEYLKQEQDDALAIIDWLAQQGCSGKVGMIGISWAV